MAIGETKRRKHATFSFSLQERGKNVLLAKESVNCDCRLGSLKSGMGATPLRKSDGSTHTCPEGNVTHIVIRKDLDDETKTYTERIGALTDEGAFFLQSALDGEFTQITVNVFAPGIVQFAGTDSRYKLAVIGETMCAFLREDDSFDLAMMDGMSRIGCFFAHRMFIGVKPSTLTCSAPENVQSFNPSINDGGLIRFPNAGGMMVAMQVYEERLYLFFEYGILRVDAKGAVKDFKAEQLPYTGGKIYGKSVCAGVRGIYFLASDGAYHFDGKWTKRVLDGFVLCPKGETLLESGAAFAGRVFLRYETDEGYKTLVFYEGEESGYYTDFFPIFNKDDGGKCLFTEPDRKIYEFSERGEKGADGSFSSEETDLGTGVRKTLTNLYFTGRGSFTLTVKTGGRKLVRELTFQEGRAEVRLSESGERFSFDFALPYGSEVSSMSAAYLPFA